MLTSQIDTMIRREAVIVLVASPGFRVPPLASFFKSMCALKEWRKKGEKSIDESTKTLFLTLYKDPLLSAKMEQLGLPASDDLMFIALYQALKEHWTIVNKDGGWAYVQGVWRDGKRDAEFDVVEVQCRDKDNMLIDVGSVVVSKDDTLMRLVKEARDVLGWKLSDNYILANMENMFDTDCKKVFTHDAYQATDNTDLMKVFSKNLGDWIIGKVVYAKKQ